MTRSLLFLMLISISAHAQTIYPSGVTGCIARWDFTNTGTFTSLPDVSGNSNNGTVTSISTAAGWAGSPNSAGSFDGSSSFALVAHNSMLTPAEITIIALVKFDDFYSGNCEETQIISKGYPYQISGNYGLGVGDNVFDGNCGIYSPNNMQQANQFGTSLQTLSPGNYVQKGKWYFMAASYNGSNVRYYQEEMKTNRHTGIVTNIYSQAGSSVPIGSNAQDLSIGKHLNPSFPYWFKGAMDEVILFNKALTEEEVQSVYDYLWGTVYINQPFIDTVQHQGATFNVNYTASNPGIYTSGNVFTVQLSDASGSFTSAVAIGNITSTTSGTIPCTIPVTTPIGNSYRIRIVSSAPGYTSVDDGKDISIASVGIGALATSQDAYFIAYPNPSKGNFIITGETKAAEDINIEIANTIGQVIYRGVSRPAGNKMHSVIDLSNYSDGVYTIHLTGTYTNKVLQVAVTK